MDFLQEVIKCYTGFACIMKEGRREVASPKANS
jgi:hypothetical protein